MEKLSAGVQISLWSILLLVQPAFAAETPTGILAAHIRDQGFACKKAENAVRDEKLSSPNNTVWTLTCEGVSNRVTLVPDMAAKVEKLDK